MRRGIVLGTTLVVACLVLTLGFAVASLSVSHLHLQSRSTSSEVALDLARSTVNLALARVLADRNYAGTVDYRNDAGVGRLTFEDGRGLSVSKNNLSGLGAVSGPEGQVVPAQALLLIAVGESGGLKRRVEALYYLPPYDYAAASDGPIDAPGGVEVRGVGSPPGPASMLSNSPSNQALLLGPASQVTGGLKSVGGIVVDPSATVAGSVRSGQKPEDIPQLVLADYDPLLLGLTPVNLSPAYPQGNFTGSLRRQGDLDIAGDLQLTSALLFVQGNLTVGGSLTGAGVVAVTGDVTVRQSVNLAADDKLAVVAGGKLRLEGTGPASSSFQGVVYAERGIEARQLTVRGVVVAHKPNSGATGDPVLLDQVQLVKDPEFARIRLTLTGSASQSDRFYVPVLGLGRRQVVDMVPFGDYYSVEIRREPPDLYRAYILRRGRIPEGLVRPGSLQSVADQIVGFTEANLDQVRERLQELGTTPPGVPGSAEIVVDPSRFLPDAERIRVLSWRELSVAR
jgi:hypothetical protein